MPQEVAYDYIAGISVGSIIASVLATFEPGNEQVAVELLSEFVMGFKPSDLFPYRSPLLTKLFTENSMMTVGPLRDALTKIFGKRPILRKVSIASVDIVTGQVIYFDETMSIEDRLNAVLSSAAIPFAFPPVTLDDLTMVDGSVFSTVSLGDPIERCREEGTKDEDIIIDVILCYEDISDYSV
jgi:predicted acylesterase/phospholipase RssA